LSAYCEMRPKLKAPSVVNLEITDVCNEKCRHCYNFWRIDNSKTSSLTKEKFDELVDTFVEAGVFHVVLTGGEPFARFDLLEYGLRKLRDNNISLSCNSNLSQGVTAEKIRRLVDAGLDHILTSLMSYDRETNDYMAAQEGAFDRIVEGIQLAVNGGIRISVNMVVGQRNLDHVYETGKFVHTLGCQKIFGTRTVPSVNLTNANGTEFELSKKDALHILDQLVRVKEETGIMIGTLVSYPLCLLGDLDRYKDFVGRGCPAQNGHLLSLNADGNVHACSHEEQSYGNIFTDGIYKVYENTQKWHDGSYLYEGCKGCDYIEICQAGCRMSSRGYNGTMNGPDQLMVGKEGFVRPYKIVYDDSIYQRIDSGMRFTVPKRLRFREEDGFYLVNARWANTITCPADIARFLIRYQSSGLRFTLDEFGLKNRTLLAKLFFKDIVESEEVVYHDLRSKAGLSADIMLLA
jgi:radical SAM protein with 4Fe4S-binding SPASM domain